MESSSSSYSLLVPKSIHDITIPQLLALAFGALIAFSSYLNRVSVDAPIVGYRSWLEPTFLVRLRFLFDAKGILTRGYYQVMKSSMMHTPGLISNTN
jgi:hypothetical protein